MAQQGICMVIDIRTADTGEGEKSGPFSYLRQVKYVALDERGIVRLDKIYGSATPQNSIDFLKRVVAHIPNPISSIYTDSGLAFHGEFTKYLEIYGIRHERNLQNAPSRISLVL